MNYSKEQLEALFKTKLKSFKTKEEWQFLVEKTCQAIQKNQYNEFKKYVYENVYEKEMDKIIRVALKKNDAKFLHFLIFEKKIETKLDMREYWLISYPDKIVLFFLQYWDELVKAAHIFKNEGIKNLNDEEIRIQIFYEAIKDGRLELVKEIDKGYQKYDFKIAFTNALQSESFEIFSYVVEKMDEKIFNAMIYDFFSLFEKEHKNPAIQKMMIFINENKNIYQWEEHIENLKKLDYQECLSWIAIYQNKNQLSQDLKQDDDKKLTKLKI